MGWSLWDNQLWTGLLHRYHVKMTIPILFKKYNFPQFSAEWRQKLIFVEILLKIHSNEREKASENLNQISFVNLAVLKNPNFQVYVLSLASSNIEKLMITSFSQLGLKTKLMCFEIEVCHARIKELWDVYKSLNLRYVIIMKSGLLARW